MKNETRHSCLNATRIVINVKITLSPDMAFLLTYQLVFSCTSTSSTYTTGPPLEFVDFTDLVDGLGDGLRSRCWIPSVGVEVLCVSPWLVFGKSGSGDVGSDIPGLGGGVILSFGVTFFSNVAKERSGKPE